MWNPSCLSCLQPQSSRWRDCRVWWARTGRCEWLSGAFGSSRRTPRARFWLPCLMLVWNALPGLCWTLDRERYLTLCWSWLALGVYQWLLCRITGLWLHRIGKQSTVQHPVGLRASQPALEGRTQASCWMRCCGWCRTDRECPEWPGESARRSCLWSSQSQALAPSWRSFLHASDASRRLKAWATNWHSQWTKSHCVGGSGGTLPPTGAQR